MSLLAVERIKLCSTRSPWWCSALVLAAGVGLAVAAWFLQTWSDFAVAWTYWGIAGAMLGLARQRVAVAAEEARPQVPAPAVYRPGAPSSVPSASR